MKSLSICMACLGGEWNHKLSVTRCGKSVFKSGTSAPNMVEFWLTTCRMDRAGVSRTIHWCLPSPFCPLPAHQMVRPSCISERMSIGCAKVRGDCIAELAEFCEDLGIS